VPGAIELPGAVAGRLSRLVVRVLFTLNPVLFPPITAT
jgi:hypothetical protein